MVRVFANKAKEAAQASDNKWAPFRWVFLNQYTSMLCDYEQFILWPTPEDWKTITKNMSKDESEPILFRTEALLVVRCLNDNEGEHEEGAEDARSLGHAYHCHFNRTARILHRQQ